MSKFQSVLAIVALWCLSIVCCVPTFPKVQKEAPSKQEFSMQINEQGSQFTEKVTFDKKKKTIVHDVPAHRDLSESQVMLDFTTNLTVTRMVTKRICYVRPTSHEEQSFDALKNDMDTVSNRQLQMQTGFQLIKTIWRVKGPANLTKLSYEVLDFCRGLIIYEVEKSEYDETKLVKVSRSKRNVPSLTINSCYTKQELTANLAKCAPSQRVYRCGVLANNCYRFITCAVSLDILNTGQCTDVHRTDSFTCCNPWCPN